VQPLNPTFTIVIPTYNRVERLQRVISALEQQSYPLNAFEVVVVSDGSTDGTDAYLSELRSKVRVRWFTQPNRGPAAARNLAVEKADGEIILFIDDDVVPEPQTLQEHARCHAQANGDVVVLGPLLNPAVFKMSPWVRWEQETLMKQYRALERGDWSASARQFYTGNASLKRRHILSVGGFDESFRRAEDVELAYRLANRGLSFVFNMQAVGRHFAERSFRAWLDAAYTYGRNDVIFARDRNQKWLLPSVRREFRERNVLVQLLIRLCGGRPRTSRFASRALKFTADTATFFDAGYIEQRVYSGLFNLNYYSGFILELKDVNYLFSDPDDPT
jgi:GT2 family glycosyltransferase